VCNSLTSQSNNTGAVSYQQDAPSWSHHRRLQRDVLASVRRLDGHHGASVPHGIHLRQRLGLGLGLALGLRLGLGFHRMNKGREP